MQVVDEITRKLVDVNECPLVVVNHVSGQVIFGYVRDYSKVRTILVYINGSFKHLQADLSLMKKNLIFSNQRGMYMSKIDLPQDVVLSETLIMGQGGFPYSFERKYEAVENFSFFNGKQKVVRFTSNPISKHLKYTFGLEFETSQGYIPEDLCLRDGLIPLRDGSISGLEYSTVVLGKNRGICLLKQQLKTLKEYTSFNKECSLHIHFGGFPIEAEALFRLYYLYKKLEPSIENLVPALTFKSGEYKQNGKNYCKKLPIFKSFDELYKHLVGRRFYGSLTQPHPKDVERKRKWNIPTRYYALNFINAICYGVNKTIEFRFLRPTYNYNKILLWLYIFNAILRFAEENKDLSLYHAISLKDLIYRTYPPQLADAIQEGMLKLNILRINQVSDADYCGQIVSLEDKLFTGKMNF